ncbi:hypothetical protein BX600DRAFT_55608 [Xylariales sp. PMI_506]|nr:hypothetical protein BX600DRAFT_55608 [Xylariales sp. PMI_506]
MPNLPCEARPIPPTPQSVPLHPLVSLKAEMQCGTDIPSQIGSGDFRLLVLSDSATGSLGFKGLAPALDGRSRYSQKLWDKYKDEIRQIYLIENKSVDATVKIIHSRGLTVSKTIFRRKLMQWGFCKNNRKSAGRTSYYENEIKRGKLAKEKPQVCRNREVGLKRRCSSSSLESMKLPEELYCQERVIHQLDLLARRQFDPERRQYVDTIYHSQDNLKYLNLITTGSFLIQFGRLQEGWDLLNRGFKYVPAIFNDPQSFTAPLELLLYVYNYHGWPTTTELWKFLAEYSRTILHGAHPLNDLFHGMHRISRQLLPSIGMQVLRNILEELMRRFDSEEIQADPRLSRLMPWSHSYMSCSSSDWPQLRTSLVGRMKHTARIASRRRGEASVEISAAVEDGKSRTWYPDEKGLDIAMQTVTQTQLGEHIGHPLYSVGTCWLALHHRRKWMESMEPAQYSSRHQLARHHLEAALAEGQELCNPEHGAECVALLVTLASWQREAGLEGQAKSTDERNDEVIQNLASEGAFHRENVIKAQV